MKITKSVLKQLIKEELDYSDPDIEDLGGPRRANRYGEPRRGVEQTSAVTDRSKIDSPKKQIHSVSDMTPYQALATKALEGPPKIFDNRALERLFHAARSGRDQNAQAMLDAVIEQRPEIGRDVEHHLKMMRAPAEKPGLSPAEIDAIEDMNEGHKSVKITKNKLKQLIKEQYEAVMLPEQSDITRPGPLDPSELRGDIDHQGLILRHLTRRVDALEKMVGKAGEMQRYEEGLRPDVFQEVMDELE